MGGGEAKLLAAPKPERANQRRSSDMKALVAPSYAALEEISVTEVIDPRPGPGQVLIRVRAAALNPLDIALITGGMRELMPVEHPFVVGMDAAGTVAEVGEGVTDYTVGDEVVTYTHFHPGTIAEYTVGTVGPTMARRPAGLGPVPAAAMAAVSLSAECVIEAAAPAAGQTVLIIGATGGVGSFAVQLAARAGARVLATAVPDDRQYALSLGAGEVIDYTGIDPIRYARQTVPEGVDVVIDLINRGPALADTAACVREGGRLVSTLMGPAEFDRGIVPSYVRMAARDGRLEWLLGEVAAGRLTVEVAAVYPLAEAAQAMADFAAGKYSRGKIVVTAASES